MKLEPVYVLAPLPAPKSMPTRRAWVLAGFAFAVGAATAVCATWFGIARTPPAPPLDPTHAWLRAICDDGTPVDELLKHRLALYMRLPTWRDDPLLWHGIDRLAEVLVARADLAERRRLALELVQFLEHVTLPAGAADRWDIGALRAVAGGR